jgi:hypothetical protein
MSDMDIYEIRRRNLARIVKEKNGTIVELAKQAETSANYLTQVLSERVARHMGSTVARRIESKLELPEGWMDSVTDTPSGLSDAAVMFAQQFDRLPDHLKTKIARELDTLVRYVGSDD